MWLFVGIRRCCGLGGVVNEGGRLLGYCVSDNGWIMRSFNL